MFQRKVLVAFAFVVGALFSIPAAPALAVTCTVPYNASNGISNGLAAQPSQINSNFASLAYCGNNIDNVNIGSAGLYASQIVPTNGSQATFGGSQPYSFPQNVSFGTSSTGGTLYANDGTVRISGGYYAGASGTPGTALTYGTNVGAVTQAAIASNNGSAPLGVTSNLMGVFTQPAGFNAMSLDTTGDVAFPGAIHGGSITSPGAITGAAVTSSSSVQGSTINSAYLGSNTNGIFYAGGGNAASLDYNLANAGRWTLSAPLSVSGGVAAAGPVTASSVASSSFVSGSTIDSAYNNSTTQGIYYAGGSNVASLDYNITTGSTWTFNTSLNVSGKLQAYLNGALASEIPTVINNTSGGFGNGAHWHVGTATTSAGGTVVSNFSGFSFDATPYCLVSYGAAPSANTALYMTSTSTAYSITGAPSSVTNWACAGT